MASITVRKLDDKVKRRLKVRAARNGRSMEAEARDILRMAVAEKSPKPNNLYDSIREKVDPIGGFELPELPDEPVGDPRVFK